MLQSEPHYRLIWSKNMAVGFARAPPTDQDISNVTLMTTEL